MPPIMASTAPRRILSCRSSATSSRPFFLTPRIEQTPSCSRDSVGRFCRAMVATGCAAVAPYRQRSTRRLDPPRPPDRCHKRSSSSCSVRRTRRQLRQSVPIRAASLPSTRTQWLPVNRKMSYRATDKPQSAVGRDQGLVVRRGLPGLGRSVRLIGLPSFVPGLQLPTRPGLTLRRPCGARFLSVRVGRWSVSTADGPRAACLLRCSFPGLRPRDTSGRTPEVHTIYTYIC